MGNTVNIHFIFDKYFKAFLQVAAVTLLLTLFNIKTTLVTGEANRGLSYAAFVLHGNAGACPTKLRASERAKGKEKNKRTVVRVSVLFQESTHDPLHSRQRFAVCPPRPDNPRVFGEEAANKRPRLSRQCLVLRRARLAVAVLKLRCARQRAFVCVVAVRADVLRAKVLDLLHRQHLGPVRAPFVSVSPTVGTPAVAWVELCQALRRSACDSILKQNAHASCYIAPARLIATHLCRLKLLQIGLGGLEKNKVA